MSAVDPLRFVLVGHPVACSLSPVLHGVAFRALGLPHRYDLVDAPDEAVLARVVDDLRAGRLAGANVTLPHKVAALRLADAADDSAASVGAANTLCFEAGRVVAHNTDVGALERELADLLILRAGGDLALGEGGAALAPGDGGASLAQRGAGAAGALVMGGGGAAFAAIAACRRLGLSPVFATSRSWRDDAALASSAGARAAAALGATLLPWPTGGVEHTDAWAAAWPRLGLVVQATSAGMRGKDPGEAVAAIVRWNALPDAAAAYDVVYIPRETPFLVAARARSLRAEGGLGMLVRQAAASLTLWTGLAPPIDAMRAAADAAFSPS